MNKTSIEWVKNPDGSQGYTWNPITGCLNGCSYCYARKLANGRLRRRYLDNPNVSPSELGTFPHLDPFYPRFWPERLEDFKTHPKHRKGVFVCDMGELFGDWVPREWQDDIFSVIKAHPQHRFYLLTKQPGNLPNFSPFPKNCFVGVTATGASMFEAATAYLAGIEASVKYISIEPLLNWHMGPNCMAGYLEERGINWLILGSQTKPYRPPEIESVREIVSAADHVGTSVFLKDNLSPITGDPRHNFNLYNHFEPINPVLRQEMPK